jgi:glycosyltransferase involved in cell wall biosynthesis
LSIKGLVEEIIVIDSGSTDATIEIAKSLGAKTIYNPWEGYVKQKSFGESLCKNQWILNIDADEEVSKELREEIDFIFSSQLQDKYKAYKIKVTIMHR